MGPWAVFVMSLRENACRRLVFSSLFFWFASRLDGLSDQRAYDLSLLNFLGVLDVVFEILVLVLPEQLQK